MTVVATIALACVAGLLSGKFSRPLQRHFQQWSAQRPILSLTSPGEAFDFASAQPATSMRLSRLDRLTFDWAHDQSRGTVYVGRLQNALGADRVVSIKLFPGIAMPPTRLAFSMVVRDVLHWWRPERSLPHGPWWLGAMDVDCAATLHVDPPTLDPLDPKRLLVSGIADGTRFSYEFGLDAHDVVTWHALPTTRPAVPAQSN